MKFGDSQAIEIASDLGLLEGFFFIDEVDDVFTVRELIDDNTNLVDVLKRHDEVIWQTGSAYNASAWDSGDYEELGDFSRELLEEVSDEDLKKYI